MKLTNDDLLMLKDTIGFVLDNDTDLDEQGAKDLWEINLKLNSIMELNAKYDMECG
tara:strand:- start:816 stop:983 length:168 start_codon:yes stop_codon:yes gene_type:complete